MRTSRFAVVAAAAACLLVPSLARAADKTPAPPPTPAPAMSAAETQFVTQVTSDLQHRFGTTAAATAAGYFRYTDEDDTGAISWVNTSDWKSDATHPAQLWYDVNGRLIGADFSTPKTASPPSLWGISAGRWIDIPRHVHFGVKAPAGLTFGGYGPKTAAKFGATLEDPTAADVVKVGKAKSADEVAFVFVYPAIWDLQVWLVPNPLGPFAEHNPSVKPSPNAKIEM
jgi:hypothetical protein